MTERRFEIDRRPIVIVLISRLRRQLLLALMLGVFALLLGMEPPEGLSEMGWETLCTFFLCGSLWATGLLPPAITSLLAMALVPMLGILDARTTYAYFGSTVVFFILGALMLSAALIGTGLSKRLATSFVRRFGRTPRQLVLAVFLLCAAASTLMSEHAVAVMMFPIVRDMARSLKLDTRDSNMGRGLYFALAWGCIIGGTLTVLGGGRGPLAIGLLEEATGEASTITFLGYIAYTWPLVAILVGAAIWMLHRHFRPEVDSTEPAVVELEASLHEMGKTSPQEQVVGLVLVVTVVLWAWAGDTLGLANIALVSMAALFALGTLKWADIQQHVNWGIVVMYGGAICLGGVMERSGAAAWLTEQVVDQTLVGPAALMMILAVVSAVLTEFMSNSAVVAMLIPPALALADAYGIDLRAMTMTIVLPSNFAYMFPISTPVTGIAWSGGYFSPGLVARHGLMLHLVSWAAMALLIGVYWPMVGLA